MLGQRKDGSINPGLPVLQQEAIQGKGGVSVLGQAISSLTPCMHRATMSEPQDVSWSILGQQGAGTRPGAEHGL